ncbi:MAG TPA: NHLP-related RiPP peptide [Dokdonella sp.]
MSDAVLTIDQCRRLMHELATNDGFRRRFEAKPAAALVEIGVPAAVVVNLDPCCLAPKQLGDRKIFAAAARQLDEELLQRYAAFNVPAVRIGGAGSAPG